MMVVLSHLSLAFYPYLHNIDSSAIPDANWIQSFLYNSPFLFFVSGKSAVFIFFVLSGIVLSRSVDGKNIYRHFDAIISRLPRLMIPSLFSCIIVFVLFKYLFTSWDIGLTKWIDGLYVSPSLTDALYNGSIRPFFLDGSSYNSVLWTMKIELFGSFLIYLFSLLAGFSSLIASSGLFLLLSLFSFLIGGASLSLGFLCFWFGFVIFKFDIKIKNKYLCLLTFVVGLYLAGAHNDSWSYSLISSVLKGKTYIVCNFISGIMIVLAVYSNDMVQKRLNNKHLVKLGHMSFSIYLIHLSVISLVCYYFYNPILAYLGAEYTAIILSIFVILVSILLAKPMIYVDNFSVKVSKLCRIFSKDGQVLKTVS